MTYCTKKISAVFVFEKNEKFLFLKRTDAFRGWYLLPGGHVDEGEQIVEAGVRELKEELGLIVHPSDLEFVMVKPDRKYINFFFRVRRWNGEPKNMEPQKHANMAWLDLSDSEIYPDVVEELKTIKIGQFYMEK